MTSRPLKKATHTRYRFSAPGLLAVINRGWEKARLENEWSDTLCSKLKHFDIFNQVERTEQTKNQIESIWRKANHRKSLDAHKIDLLNNPISLFSLHPSFLDSFQAKKKRIRSRCAEWEIRRQNFISLRDVLEYSCWRRQLLVIFQVLRLRILAEWPLWRKLVGV